MSYHMRFAAMRAVGMSNSLENDRHLIIAAIQDAVTAIGAFQKDKIVISILGSADAGLLAASAHAVALLGSPVLENTRFVVSDLCGTPLQLCREFAQLHGLDLTTHQLDLADTRYLDGADVFLMHSLLRHVPAEKRVRLLTSVQRALLPGGRFIFSNYVYRETDYKTKGLTPSRRLAVEHILQLVRTGLLQTEIPIEQLSTNLSEANLHSQTRDAVIKHLEDGIRLLEQAGFTLLRAEINDLQSKGADLDGTRQRFLAVTTSLITQEL
jgi:SAM-dependent methyltransferase